MAINQNHLFEDLNGIKCAIVEKNVLKERVDFLKHILDYNHYTVIVVASPPPKTAAPLPAKPAPAIAPGTDPTAETFSASPLLTSAPPLPETFTVGVTDVTFNPVNALYGRLLKAPGGHIITLAYWQQKEKASRDDIPYFNT